MTVRMIHNFVLVALLHWFINLDNKELIQEMISSPSWGYFTPPNARALLGLRYWCGGGSIISLEPFSISSMASLLCPQTIKQQNIGKSPLDGKESHVFPSIIHHQRAVLFHTPSGDLLNCNKHLFRLGLWVLVSLFVITIKVIDSGASGNNRVKATSCSSYQMI